MNMNIYTVYCNAGRYDLNALVQARSAAIAKKKVERFVKTHSFLCENYRAMSARFADAAFIKEMDLQNEVRKLKRGDATTIVVYDEGT
jgi:hypothetical protein